MVNGSILVATPRHVCVLVPRNFPIERFRVEIMKTMCSIHCVYAYYAVALSIIMMIPAAGAGSLAAFCKPRSIL